MLSMNSVLVACSWIAVGFAIARFQAHRRETRVLRELLQFTFGPDWNGRIETIDQLLRIKRLLNERITYLGVSMARKRPLLRDSACETLALGKGYCGENSRVAVRLLTIGGVKANRMYLTNGKWGHVYCEILWDGGRKLFDGHYDTEILVPDDHIGQLDSVDIARISHKDGYPWKDYHRIKLFTMVPGLSRFAKTPVPFPLPTVFESPALITGLASLCLALFLRLAASFF